MNGEKMAEVIKISQPVIWISKDDEHRRRIREASGNVVYPCLTVDEGLRLLTGVGGKIVVVEMPGMGYSATSIFNTIHALDRDALVIFWNPQGSVQEAVELVKLGAFHYMSHPVQVPLDEVSSWVNAAIRKLASAYGEVVPTPSAPTPSRDEPWRRFLVGESPPMRKLAEIIQLVASRRSTVLITGETGTGKEVVAKAVHLSSPRAASPIVTVNCTALPETLLESELFGHTKGAFTGASQARVGRFEQANNSTIFLDEIGDMPMDTQAKLLRVIQEKEYQRLGSSEVHKIDVRVIAATNVDLAKRATEGRFREDLFYRLNVVPIEIPPLRERLPDIPQLVNFFIHKLCTQEGIEEKFVSPDTIDSLMKYHWPGNVRQLENAVDRAITLSGNRSLLLPSDFPLASAVPIDLASDALAQEILLPENGLDFETTVNRLERALIEQAMRRTHGNIKQAADMLGLKRTTLAAKRKSLEAVAS